jgi:hypothetical protein
VTYDAFVSYAKEDEAQARAFRKRLESARLRVFFAPLVFRQSEVDLHARLLETLADARVLVLLWSGHVGNSQWVSLESSIFVTLPERTGGETRRVIVIDFGGPRLPGWLRYDLALRPDQESELEALVRNPDSIATFARSNQSRQSPVDGVRTRATRALRLAYAALFDLPAWTAACRAPLLRLGP